MQPEVGQEDGEGQGNGKTKMQRCFLLADGRGNQIDRAGKWAARHWKGMPCD